MGKGVCFLTKMTRRTRWPWTELYINGEAVGVILQQKIEIRNKLVEEKWGL